MLKMIRFDGDYFYLSQTDYSIYPYDLDVESVKFEDLK